MLPDDRGRWKVTGGTREDVPCGGEQAWEEPTAVICVKAEEITSH